MVGEKKVAIWDLPDVSTMGEISENLERQRNLVFCNSDAPTHTASVKYGGAYASTEVDNSLTLEKFRKNFKIKVKHLDKDDIEFDMVGIDASIANAFRRILIAELPTMAIENVVVANSTSVVQDDVLAHRLGLIPLKVDPRLFEYLSENDVPNEKNTIVFKLHVHNKKADRPRHAVKSAELKWLPNGSEFLLENPDRISTSKPKTYTSFSCSQDSIPEFSKNPIAPTCDDITIAVLGVGQEIELEAHAVKGIGKTHAKWSPVATAWYRMHPKVELLQDVEGEKANELVKKCPVNVFDIEDLANGKKRAKVNKDKDKKEKDKGKSKEEKEKDKYNGSERYCTLCRECINGGWDEFVAVNRINNHFIFKIESTGALPPEVLFTEAVKILEDKCERLITELS